MKHLHWILIFYLWKLASTRVIIDDFSFESTARNRRSAIEFYALIQCHQPSTIALRAYGDYGCFCGVGGNGNSPLDATDGCCKTHDDCYRPLKNSISKSYSESFMMAMCGELCVPYSKTCKNGTIVCDSDNSPLSMAVCECDKAASICFAGARSTYDKRLGNVDPNIWCTEESNVTDLLSQLENKDHPKSTVASEPSNQILHEHSTTADLEVTPYTNWSLTKAKIFEENFGDEGMYDNTYNDDVIQHLPVYPRLPNATEDTVLLARLRVFEGEITEKSPGGSGSRVKQNLILLVLPMFQWISLFYESIYSNIS
ncbi:uncharacterized protein LOC144422036 [Styela clava]